MTANPPSHTTPPKWSDVLAAIKRRKPTVIFTFLLVSATVAVVTFSLPRAYRSEGKMFFRLGRENVTLDPSVTLGQEPTVFLPQSRENEMNTIVEILSGRTMLGRVVDAVGAPVILRGKPNGAAATTTAEAKTSGGMLAGAWGKVSGSISTCREWVRGSSATLSARDQAIEALGKKLTVWAPRRTDVIDVSYEGGSPELAQAVVANLMELYRDQHERLYRPEKSREFFTAQAEHSLKELRAKEDELRNLKTASGLMAFGDQRDLIVHRLGRLEDELMQADTARAVSESKVKSLRQQLVELPAKEVTTATDGHGNAGTDAMREQLFALQVREQEARAHYTETHPKMEALRKQVMAASKIVKQEDSTRTEVTTAGSRAYDEARVELMQELPVLASCQARSNILRQQVAELRGNTGTLNEREVQIARLERDIDIGRTNYRRYSVNLEQARIDQALEAQRMSNVAIVEPATLDPRPIRPQRMLNVALGLLLGLFLGLTLAVVRESLDHTIRTPADVGQRIGLPLVAVVPPLAAGDLVLTGQAGSHAHGGHGNGNGSNGNGSNGNGLSGNGGNEGANHGNHGNGHNGNGNGGRKPGHAHSSTAGAAEQ
jgi:polysaccharide biosynthesis protein PslE